jgi:hypothetical protein
MGYIFQVNVKMFARKRRETTYLKKIICQEQENDIQNSESMNTYNAESESMESDNFKGEFEFSFANIKNWESFIHFIYKPMDPASLGLIRIMFGEYDTALFRSDGSSSGAVCICKLESMRFHTVIIR